MEIRILEIKKANCQIIKLKNANIFSNWVIVHMDQDVSFSIKSNFY